MVNNRTIQLMISALRQIRRKYMHGLSEPQFGICNEMSGLLPCGVAHEYKRLCRGASETWPYWSGFYDYPVPSTMLNLNNDLPAPIAYSSHGHGNMRWQGEYGQMRMCYLNHQINYLSNLLED